MTGAVASPPMPLVPYVEPESAPLPARIEETIVRRWLKRLSKSTRVGYKQDLEYFRRWLDVPTEADAVDCLLGYGRTHAIEKVVDYQIHMRDERGLSPATCNRRVCALKSIVKLQRKLGRINWKLDVDNYQTKAYRDTAGPKLSGFNRMLRSFDDLPDKPKHLRDRLLVLIMFLHGLRRKEVAGISEDDLDLGGMRVKILGKHREEPEWVTIAKPVKSALESWLKVRPEPVRDDEGTPVFVSVDNRCRGSRLDPESINRISKAIGRRVGLARVNAHSLRHAGATALLDSGVAPRTVMRWGRWSSLSIVSIYDDSRADLAGAAGDILAGKIA